MAETPRSKVPSADDERTVPHVGPTPLARQQPPEHLIGTALFLTERQFQPPPEATAVAPGSHFGPPLHPGDLGSLGPYRIIKELGRGGMGAVYLGFDERLKRRVALKVMLPKYAVVPAAKNRFLREARAAAALGHDHIVTIHEADEREGVTYMAMQLLQGQPLDARLSQTPPLELREVIRIGRETALGLAAAHHVGLVHRDIKPANLWLEAPTGRVKILDFGIAKPTEEENDETEHTATGVVMGTPSYMAPEQALGERTDFRADLFSLGVLLYRLCTGRLPFGGTTPLAVLASALNDPPPPIRGLNPNVPPPLESLILRLMAKKPHDRPASAEQVADALWPMELGQTVGIAVPVPADAVDSFAAPTRTDPFMNIDAPDAAEPAVVHLSATLPVPRPKPPRWPLAALAALCLAVLVLTPILAQIMTPKGVLAIDSNDPDAEVIVKRDGKVVVERSKQRDFTLRAGVTYTIELADPKDNVRLTPDRFEITKNGRAVVKLRSPEKTVAARPKEAVSPAEFVEAHGVTPAALKTWAEKLPKGTRPVWIAPRSGSKPLVLDAVATAAPTDTEWAVDVSFDTSGTLRTEREKNGFYPAQRLPLPADGTLWLWVKGDPTTGIAWAGSRALVEDRLLTGRKLDQRPTVVTAKFEKNEILAEAVLAPAAKVDWDTHLDLSADDLAAVVTAYRAKGWRPASVAVQQDRTPVRYAAVFRENKPAVEWEFTPDLTVADYEKQLAERKAKGVRPQCVWSHAADGAVYYGVVWESIVDADRRAAEWVVSVGGWVQINDGQRFDKLSELPKTRFALTTINFNQSSQIADADLALIRNCTNLKGVFLSDTVLGGSAVAHLRALINLDQLELGRVPMGDAGAENLKGMAQLTGLSLMHTRLSNAGLANLKDMRRLKWLNLNDNALDDRCLVHLEGLHNLDAVNLTHTQVTEEGLKRLAETCPFCTIQWDGGVIPAKTTQGDVNRGIAAHVLALGGYVELNNQPRLYWKAAELPDEVYYLTTIGLGAHPSLKPVDDAAVLPLKLCRNTKRLSLHKAAVTATGLAVFEDCDELEYLDFGGTATTTAGLANFKSLMRLESLDLSETQVDAVGLARLRDCPRLRELSLTGVRLTAADLAAVGTCKALTHLKLGRTAVDDAGLVYLEGLSHLIELDLTGTKVTPGGVDRLRSRLPNCRVIWNDLDLPPQPERFIAQWVFALGGTVRVDGQPADITTPAGLPQGRFQLSFISLKENSTLGRVDFEILTGAVNVNVTEVDLTSSLFPDAGMPNLARCPKLAVLTLNGTKVTLDGIAHLKDSKTLTELNLFDTPTTDDALVSLAGCTALRKLNVTHTFVTKVGIDTLAKKLPRCRIEFSGGVIPPAKE